MPTTTPFANLITFSRGSNATLVGPNGLVQWAPSNLLTFSEQFDNAAWIKTTATVTANSTTAPDGTNTADTLTPTSADSNVRQEALPGAVAPHTFSIWLRSATGANISTTLRAWRVSPFQAVTSTAITVTPTWQRFTLTFTPLDATAHAVVVGASSTLSTGQNLFAWGAQLELGTAATTYNPTTVKNLLGFSEAFDNAAWTKSNSSIVTGAAANPINGLFNAQKLMEDTSTGAHLVQQPLVGTVGNPQTLSFYAKAAGRNWVAVQMGAGAVAYFDLVNGVVGNVSAGATATITAVGNGWYRCAISATRATNLNNLIYCAISNGNLSYTGDGNSGVFIYGAQLSDSASLDPYVPTPGAAPSSTAYYGPRFDYDPVTRAARGILIEEQRTNLLLRSAEFDNASWVKSSATVTANSTISPDGTANADTLTPNSSISGVVEQDVTFTGNGDKAVSIFLKAGTSTTTYVFVRDTTVPATRGRALITWTGGVPSATADNGGTIQGVDNFGNGWYRLRLLATNVVAANANAFRVQPDPIAGTGSVIAWGAQAENGAFATSYIPTIASTVTRSADVATITGQNFGQWFGATAGTFVVEFTATTLNASGVTVYNAVSADAGSGANQISLYTYSNFAAGRVVTSSVTQADINGGGSPANNAVIKSGIAYAANNVAVTVNGATPGTDTSVTLPTVDRLPIGSQTGGNYLNGWLRSIRYIPVRAADFQLQALTT